MMKGGGWEPEEECGRRRQMERNDSQGEMAGDTPTYTLLPVGKHRQKENSVF